MSMQRDTQLICTACGSSFFYVARAEQFAAGGYGSAEFRSVSNAPKTVLVCLCGQPVTPKPGYYSKGTVAAVAEDGFRKSVEAAQKHRTDNSIQNVAKISATPSEVQAVRDSVEEIRKAVVELARPAAPQPKADPKPEPRARKTKSEVA